MNHGYNTSRVKTNSKGGGKGGKGRERNVTSLDVNAHRGETIMSRRNYMLSKLALLSSKSLLCKIRCVKKLASGSVYIRTGHVMFF